MHSDALDRLRHDQAALLAELVKAGARIIKPSKIFCPFHVNVNSSAGGVYEKGGHWRYKCHSCGWNGDVFDIRAVNAGRPLADILCEAREQLEPASKPSAKAAPVDWTVAAKCYYEAMTDERRAALADVLGLSVDSLKRMRYGWDAERNVYTIPMRDGGGTIIGIRTRTQDGKKFCIGGSRNGLFIPGELSGAGPLIIGEGASDTPAALDMGYDGIGRPNNTAGEDMIVEYLTKHPRAEVWIIYDIDPKPSTAQTTKDAAERLEVRIMPLVGSVKVFTPPAPHKDIRAWRIAGAGQDDIDAAAAAVPSRGPAGDLRRMLEGEIDGTRRAIPWPWRLVSRGTQSLTPGTITLVGGDPGSGKSLLLLEAAAYWIDAGVTVAVYELERTRTYHLKRALAQCVGASWLTDLETVFQRPSEALAYRDEHAGWLDSIGRRIWEAPDKPVRLLDLVAWVGARAVEGARIIVIDPITAADAVVNPWADAQTFMHTVRPIIDRYGASLILITHPRKDKHKSNATTLDDLAGGAAWQRLADCILWLERPEEPRQVTVKNCSNSYATTTIETINRIMRLMKTRDGRGAGWQVAFHFDPQTLRFS